MLDIIQLKYKKLTVVLLFLILGCVEAQDDILEQGYFINKVTINVLNKVTAKVSKLKLLVGQVLIFNNLSIKLHKAWKSNPEEKPEIKAFFEVNINNYSAKCILYGWMFSSDTVISTLEHPIYDLWIVDGSGKITEQEQANVIAIKVEEDNKINEELNKILANNSDNVDNVV